MNEDFLQYVWKYRRFTSQNLSCTNGDKLEIINPGTHNQDAGPDFSNARLRIGDTLWVGNVEVHINASDWFRHNHHLDTAYDNVILHVVFTADQPVLNKNGQAIPVLDLKNLLDYQTYRYYKSWVKTAKFIPCDNLVKDTHAIVKQQAVEAASVLRLEEKSEVYLDALKRTKGDIEESFYRILCRSLGMKVNALPFEQLAINTPYGLLRKVAPKLHDLEALLLGQAGFLTCKTENHPEIKNYKSTFQFQRTKFNLDPMPQTAWKLFRLRPMNFPAIRIAQLAALYHSRPSLAQSVIDADKVQDYFQLFSCTLHDFWNTHYTLQKSSEPKKKNLGKTAAQLIIVNAVVPFLFALASYNRDMSFRERAISILEALPPEKNKVVSGFQKLDFKAQSAFDTQGLISLKKSFCEPVKCLICKVGTDLLKNHGNAN